MQLAVVTTDLGAGVFHYEYALMNFDFERQIRSFSLPLDPGQTVSNPGFGDGGGDPLDDWTVSLTDRRITWTAPAGKALDWGTLLNFRMDVDAAPLETVAILESGSLEAVAVRTIPEPGVGVSIGVALPFLALLSRRREQRRRAISRCVPARPGQGTEPAIGNALRAAAGTDRRTP